MKLTLDWNCVIEVEEGRPQANRVTELIRLHRFGCFEVALLAASASENTKSKRFPGNANVFKARIASLGWQDLPLVPMPSIFGLSYFDFCYFVGDGEKFERDMDAIWRVIAPSIPREPVDHLPVGKHMTDDAIQSEELSKWRNTWCDVISAYSHIHEGRDIFVTNNTKDFQKNAKELAKLGMMHISTPTDALANVEQIRTV
ncbi:MULTISPECIES: hypothetical protein [Alphaproteobacteria]|uniref:hypothetical protein n=1 Tax=Alphaproteobacteria TaxID=28211 RepID=UPI003263256E